MNRYITTTAKIRICLVSLALMLGMPAAQGHTGEVHVKRAAAAPISSDEHEFGRQGDPKKVTRTVVIEMTDKMRFAPGDVVVRQGETIRFVVANKGKMMHEMVLGTMAQLKEHGEMMKMHPGMEHDEPYMAHVGRGKKQMLVWQFTKTGQFYYACLIPGHFDAGMIGKINVTKG
jgi:uncharacterized cupredoxin-like copper-binding protein